MSPLDDRPLSRRCALQRALRGGAGLALLGALPLLESCAGPEAPPGLRIALSRIPQGGRVVILDGELPIEIIRSGDALQARSLWCTHQGCQVVWTPDQDCYLCPCHAGIFNAAGQPISGPPELPLREYPVHLQDDVVVVDTRMLAEKT